jgi:hypothetical protein
MLDVLARAAADGDAARRDSPRPFRLSDLICSAEWPGTARSGRLTPTKPGLILRKSKSTEYRLLCFHQEWPARNEGSACGRPHEVRN